MFVVWIALFVIVPAEAVGPAWGQSGSNAQWRSGGSSIGTRTEAEPASGGRKGSLAEVAVQERATLLVDESGRARRFGGTVTWQFEPGQAGDSVGGSLRAEVEFPQTGLKAVLTMTRNSDPDLPASHVVGVRFTTEAGSVNGGVEAMTNIVMKATAESVEGASLAGSVVDVKDGFFLVGLTAGMREGNVRMLRDQAGFEIPVSFANRQRALIWFEKGNSGSLAIDQALASWGDVGAEPAFGKAVNAAVQEPGSNGPSPSDGGSGGTSMEAGSASGRRKDPLVEFANQQRATLLVEDIGRARRFRGSVSWKFEPGKAGDSGAAGRLHAEVEFPQNGLKALLTMTLNSDPDLPASHVVEVRFLTPPAFVNGGVERMEDVVMKATEDEVGGTTLAGSVVNVTDGHFLVALTDAMRAGNVRLLKERSWLEIPVTFASKRRALISVGKGVSGVQAFREAFLQWGD